MTAAAFVILALAAACFAWRLATGPSLADRVIALNGLVLVGMGPSPPMPPRAATEHSFPPSSLSRW